MCRESRNEYSFGRERGRRAEAVDRDAPRTNALIKNTAVAGAFAARRLDSARIEVTDCTGALTTRPTGPTTTGGMPSATGRGAGRTELALRVDAGMSGGDGLRFDLG